MLPNVSEVGERLNRIAGLIGRMLGVELGVKLDGDRLLFRDGADDPVALDGDELVAATAEEVESNNFILDFHLRAGRAAVVAKWQEIEQSRTP